MSQHILEDYKNETTWWSFSKKLSIALYNHLSSDCPEDATVLRIIKNTPLGGLISQDLNGWCTSKLKEFIDSAFKVAGIPEGSEEPFNDLPDVPVPQTAPPKSKTNV